MQQPGTRYRGPGRQEVPTPGIGDDRVVGPDPCVR